MDITLQPLSLAHSAALYEAISANREYLLEWMHRVNLMKTEADVQNIINESMERKLTGTEHSFIIMYENKLVGRIGVYKINLYDKIGEIGYWVAADQQGKGIVTEACRMMVNYCFDELQLNRIEIQCGTENYKSQRIPERLHFTCEGIIRRGAWVHTEFKDLKLYSMLREEWGGTNNS